jgi:anti-sigma factor RsiW
MSLCQSIDTLAMAYLDDELVAEERRELELHVLDCAPCRAHLEREKTELALVRVALAPPPAPDLFKAKLARALDAEDREAIRQERRRSLSFVGRWMLPGAAMAAAAAAIVAFVAVRPPESERSPDVAREIVRQQTRAKPLEVRGASTGPWLRENFAPIEPPQFRAPRYEITLLGARLTAVSGHNAAQLRYLVNTGDNQFTLEAVVLDELRNDELTGGTPIRFGDRVLHVHQANKMSIVTYVDEHHMGYVFASERLTAQELFELVISSDLIGRAQRGR